MLAKNVARLYLLVTFDDVVNVIDDEHCDGVWRKSFEDSQLGGDQIILASHTEEFLHRIQQELGAQRAAAIKPFTFLPHDGEHELRVDSHRPVKNYVFLSQQALATEQ